MPETQTHFTSGQNRRGRILPHRYGPKAESQWPYLTSCIVFSLYELVFSNNIHFIKNTFLKMTAENVYQNCSKDINGR